MKVIINADGRTCTTLNEEGIHPDLDKMTTYSEPRENNPFFINAMKRREQAESERQTFEIDFGAMPFSQKELLYMKNELDYLGVDKGEALRPGTTHEAEIVNGKAVIK